MNFINNAHSISEQDYIIFVQSQQLYIGRQQTWRPVQYSYVSEMLEQQHGSNNEYVLVGEIDKKKCYAVELIDPISDDNFVSLRSQMHLLSEDEYLLASRSLQLMTWYKQHRFCGQCGQQTVYDSIEKALSCPPCDLVYYPRISPCIMCLITRGEECLLAHHGRHPEGLYATLAGFVEAGESLEQTLHREVYEEVNLRVKNLSYFASQSWPFPHQLMVGYFAEYDSGDIVVDGDEIADAQWFHYTDLPITTPQAETLSGQLISAFVEQHKALIEEK
ncbi:MAG: NAD(+) diphosphatase [Cellvibrionaceae bacterium]